MNTIKLEVEIKVSKNWIEDGWNKNLIKDKLKQFIECDMNPYAISHIEFKSKIVSKKLNSENDNKNIVYELNADQSYTFRYYDGKGELKLKQTYYGFLLKDCKKLFDKLITLSNL